MKTFHLEILTPERPFYVGDCLSLVVPLADGLFGIMADHTPFTAALVPGEVAFTAPDGSRRVCAVASGMVDISPSDVKLLCEKALSPAEIDEEKERIAAERAHSEMQRKQSRKDYMLSSLAFSRAVSNLRVKKHYN